VKQNGNLSPWNQNLRASIDNQMMGPPALRERKTKSTLGVTTRKLDEETTNIIVESLLTHTKD
jgi:hypothetical protein